MDDKNKIPIFLPDEPIFDPIAVDKPSGHIFIDDKHVADTLQCVHCGTHFIPIKGSRKRRGFCMRCEGVTCGKPECDACKPYEKH